MQDIVHKSPVLGSMQIASVMHSGVGGCLHTGACRARTPFSTMADRKSIWFDNELYRTWGKIGQCMAFTYTSAVHEFLTFLLNGI